MTNVINLSDYRDRQTRQREEAIDEAITGLIEARKRHIINKFRDVMNSDDPLYSFFMGEGHG